MALTIKIANLDTSELVDISEACLIRKATVRHNHTRGYFVSFISSHPAVTGTMGDGYRIVRRGNRKLLVWQDGEIIHHGRIFGVERNGDGTSNTTVVTSYDPLMELGYDSEDRAGRPVRNETGNFISPSFTPDGGSPGDPISGGELIWQILNNSIVVGNEGDPGGEGPLPIHLDIANFDIGVPPGVDLSPQFKMEWPLLIGDFIQELVATNVVDIYLRPIDPAEGKDPYAMVEFFARNLFGSDVSDIVHFDYWTGSRNAGKCRHVESFDEINNKLYDYLGPRQNQNQWLANITPSGYPDGGGGSPWGTDVTDPIDASRELYGGPGPDFGQFMQIREDDTLGTTELQPLAIQKWRAEQMLRVEPREMLFITPSPDAKALFQPYANYNVGDLIAINTGAEFGIALTDAIERVYGFDVEWDRQDVSRVSELLTSADSVA